MRLSVPTLVLLTGLVAVPVALGTPAASAAETCQGRAVTVPESEDGWTKGTPGDDVIAAGGHVEGFGGDDLICARSGWVIDAGAGDDQVFVEDKDARSSTTFILGPGDDRFEGGPGKDVVTNIFDDGYDPAQRYADDGDDVIRTYGGDDSVLAGGHTGPAQTDDVDLGEGDDTLYVNAMSGTTPASTLAGGPGADTIRLMADRGAVALYLARRELRIGQRLAASGWTDFESTKVTAPFEERGTPASILVRGTTGPDTVSVGSGTFAEDHDYNFWDGVDPVTVVLGPGDDTLTTERRVRGRLDGGDGRDAITLLTSVDLNVRLDLGTGRYTARARSEPLVVTGFQDATLVPATPYHQATLIGNQYRNRLTSPCGLIRGGPNDDEISSGNTGRSLCRSVRFYGDRGNDRIIGTNTTDLLDGGPGYDVANGLSGTDRCVAFERKANCES